VFAVYFDAYMICRWHTLGEKFAIAGSKRSSINSAGAKSIVNRTGGRSTSGKEATLQPQAHDSRTPLVTPCCEPPVHELKRGELMEIYPIALTNLYHFSLLNSFYPVASRSSTSPVIYFARIDDIYTVQNIICHPPLCK
jgi:hypothetical protein